MHAKPMLRTLGLGMLLVLLLAAGVSAQVNPAAALPSSSPEEPLAGAPAPLLPQANWSIEPVDAPRYFALMGDRSLALDAAGNPHIAYGGDALYYAWFDGTAWHTEVVDAAGGGFTSLVLDAAGHPHISYLYDDTVYYAYFDGTAWQKMVVDDSSYFYYYTTAIGLDSSGRSHVVYYEAIGNLRHAYYNGTAWQRETVESDLGEPWGTMGRLSLAIDGSDHLHVSYCDLTWDDLKYAYYDGSTWHRQTVDADGGPQTSLALDSAGRPRIAYTGEYDHLRYAAYDGSAWQIQELDTATTYDPALVLDAADHPHIARSRGVPASLYHTWFDGTGWNSESVEAEESSELYAALAIGADNRIQVSFRGMGGNLRYAVNDGSGWQIETVDVAGWTGRHNSLDLDSAGLPGISYCDVDLDRSSECQKLKYAHYDGTAWQIETIDQGLAGLYSSLAFDAAGHPHIGYCRQEPGTTDCAELRYAYSDGSSWITTTVDAGGNSASLALDSNGRPHIAYIRAGNVHHAWFDGTEWLSETVAMPGAELSLALDAEDHPAIVATGDNIALRYARWNGSAWQIETVDISVDLNMPSLALDAAGRPHLSIYNDMDGIDYIYYDGTTWHNEIVEARTGTRNSAIALDSAGQPHIVYSYAGILRYAYFDGVNWQTESVHRSGYMNAYCDLVLDADQLPHISLLDVSAGDLEYAYPAACVPLDQLDVSGPPQLPMNVAGLYSAGYTPPTATAAIVSWSNGTMGPTAAYSWTVPGDYTVVTTATNPCSRVTDTLDVHVFCEAPTAVEISGPASIEVGSEGSYAAAVLPVTASLPMTLAWDNGTVGPGAVYSWTVPGDYTVGVTATNLCGQAGGEYAVTVTPPPQPPCNPPQEADFAWNPITPTVGQVASFTATVGSTLTGWFSQTVDGLTPESYGGDLSLALDGLDRPHLCYYREGAGLIYAHLDGVEWLTETVDASGGGYIGAFCSLALDSSGRPHISYTANATKLRYASYDGLTWQIETIDTAFTEVIYTSLVLDAADLPHIAYDRAYLLTSILMYASYNGSSWSTTIVDPDTQPWVRGVSLRLAPNGLPHIVYTATPSTMRHAYWDGAAWQIEQLAAGTDASAAVDSAGTVHVAYRGNCPNCTLMYDGTVVDTVGGDWEAGSRASLALDDREYPHIAYYDAAQGDLEYAYWDGARWYTETVAGRGDVGMSPSLALASMQIPRIGYIDVDRGELQYAWLEKGATPPIAYAWDLGDGASAAGEVVQHGYSRPGVYTVVLTATNCTTATATAVHTVTVASSCDPVHDLLVYWVPLTPTAGQSVTLVAETMGTAPISYSWDLGDGAHAAGGMIQHSYGRPGVYTIAVTATNCATATATAVHTMTVASPCEPVHDAGFSWTPNAPYAGDPVDFTGTAGGASPISYTWGLGDGTFAVGESARHSYGRPGVYTVTLTATNCATATTTAVHTVTVAPSCDPVHDLLLSWAPLTPTAGQVVTLTAAASGTAPLTFTWDLGDGTYGHTSWPRPISLLLGPFASTVTHTFTTAGSYTATVTVTNACGEATTSAPVHVAALPRTSWEVYLPLVVRAGP